MQENAPVTDSLEEQNLETEKPQRRSVVAIVLGCMLIAFCLWFFSVNSAMLWDPPSAPYGIVGIFPGSLLLWYAFRQYRLLFSCEPWEMHSLSGCFIVLAVLSALFAVVMGAVFFDGADNVWSDFVVLSAFAIATMMLGIISADNNRKRGLFGDSDSQPFGKHPPFLKRYWKRDAIGLIVMGLISAGIMAYEISGIPPEYAKNVPYEEMYLRSYFPEDGRDFCYFRGMRSTMICEFTIDEQGFRDWIASDEKWASCRPINENDRVEILPPSAYETGKRYWEENANRPTVTDGLYAAYGDHRDGRAVFDRATNRAYYWTFY